MKLCVLTGWGSQSREERKAEPPLYTLYREKENLLEVSRLCSPYISLAGTVSHVHPAVAGRDEVDYYFYD